MGSPDSAATSRSGITPLPANAGTKELTGVVGLIPDQDGRTAEHARQVIIASQRRECRASRTLDAQ